MADNLYNSMMKKAKGTVSTYVKAAQDLASFGSDTKKFIDDNSPYGEKGTLNKTTKALSDRAKK